MDRVWTELVLICIGERRDLGCWFWGDDGRLSPHGGLGWD